MRLEFAVSTVILAASLGVAYWASMPAKDGEEEKVTLLSLEPKQVSEIQLVSKDAEVKAARRDGDGRFWLEWKKSEPLPAAHKAASNSASDTATSTSTDTTTAEATQLSEPAVKVTTERFLGNEKMDELLSAFAPLQALRVIGKVDAAQLKEYGLDDQSSKLVVKAGAQTVSLVLGKKSYGSRNRFVLEGDRVVLVDDQGLENLERANVRLFDRRLLSFDSDEAQKAEVKADGKSRRLGHTQRDKSGELMWSDEDEAAPAKPAYGSFMDKVTKLRLTGYADVDKEATLAQAQPFLEVVFEKDGKQLDRLSFKKLPGDKDKADYYVTSDFLGAHAKLAVSRIEPIEKDIEHIITAN